MPSIQRPLSGDALHFRLDDERKESGIRHSAASANGATFLLTIAAPEQ